MLSSYFYHLQFYIRITIYFFVLKNLDNAGHHQGAIENSGASQATTMVINVLREKYTSEQKYIII